MEVEHLEELGLPLLPQDFERVNERDRTHPELGELATRLFPLAASAGIEFYPDSHVRCDAEFVAQGEAEFHVVAIFDDDDRLPAELLRQ